MTRRVGRPDFEGAVLLLATANAGTTEDMARSKATPERSKLARRLTTAFARRQRTDGEKDDDAPDEPAKPADVAAAKRGDAPAADVAAAKPAEPAAAAKPSDAPAKPAEPAAAKPGDAAAPAPAAPPQRADEPSSDATPQPMPMIDTVRARTRTEAMGGEAIGAPPEMPKTSAPPPLALGTVESPTHMPGPREIPGGRPEDPAPAPGAVPPGDSRSLRSGPTFALIYRVGTYVISRFGTVGTRGQWRVVEYPTSASASHAYAKECSRFVSEGFSDYRD